LPRSGLAAAASEDRLEAIGFSVGSVGEPIWGDADRGVVDCEEVGVAVAVSFEGGFGAVVAVAVELDHELVVGEVRVDEVSGDFDVELGSWEAVMIGEGEEGVFELGAGGLLGFRLGGERAEGLDAATSVCALDQLV
jgi:hypothetical protein